MKRRKKQIKKWKNSKRNKKNPRKNQLKFLQQKVLQILKFFLYLGNTKFNNMKNYMIIAAAVSLALISCKKAEKRTEITENPDGSVTATTVETEKSTSLDSARINETVEKAKERLNSAGEKIDDAADKAGHELRKAGEEVKDAAAKGAEKVEKGAEKVKKDLEKK